MPFGPVYAMQLATGYMNVALPSNLARMAVNIRFFQRQGLTAPTAVASGVIDSFAGTIVQALLLGVLLIFSESSLPLELPRPGGGSLVLLWVLVAALVACVLVVVLVRRLRDAIVERVRRWWPDVRASLVALRASHKLGLLLLGSLATELLFAIALGLFARAFGAHVPDRAAGDQHQRLAAGSFIPVPGGIGVAEFGLTIGLTSAGMIPRGRDRGRAALPDLDLLPAARLGLSRHALAAAQPLPLGSRNGRPGRSRRGNRVAVRLDRAPAGRGARPASSSSRRTSATGRTTTERSRRSTRRSNTCRRGLFGICVAGIGGDVHAAGDAEAELTIMSVAKPFLFALVCEQLGRDEVRRRSA